MVCQISQTRPALRAIHSKLVGEMTGLIISSLPAMQWERAELHSRQKAKIFSLRTQRALGFVFVSKGL
jgi:hypothetical protein